MKAPKYDATQMADWQIAEAGEENMKTIWQLSDDLGLESEELMPMGRFVGKVDFSRTYKRLADKPSGRYVEVTAITPTPLGEGKTTTTIGLIQGLAKRGKRSTGAIRQPSGGPTFNIKGSAAGGGLSQCIPLSDFSLGLTGDIDAVNNAHNLGMVALTSRMQHEFNYSDEVLAGKNLRRLDIDPNNIQMKWVIDFCAQSLRNIVIGMGGKMDGFMMDSGFAISVSSEVMAILAVASDFADLRRRMGQIIVAYDKKGNPVTTADLEVDGAMTAWMVKAFNPNVIQTLEGQPIFVHAGPFANIAVGQSSVVADMLGTRLSEYHITESGFGADIGFEKFWNIKCRLIKDVPCCSVIVATIRALKMHGGGPTVLPGKKLDEAYTKENIELLEKGMSNLIAHIETVRRSGINPVVCINSFHLDTDAEIETVKRAAEAAGARCAVSRHWSHGGDGALELADAVIDASEDKVDFKFLYEDETPLRERIKRIATEVYGADGVLYSQTALEKARKFESDKKYNRFYTCMVKTHLSLSHDPALKGRPRGFTLPIRDILVYAGAEFIVPLAGDIKLMPGTASDPAFRRIDVDTETGKVTGMF
ncbi:MAG TPA: formate--tetrahydrofolate ligase [bacterium]|nr:formate--tetrahydrofolate ligase [bacterium]